MKIFIFILAVCTGATITAAQPSRTEFTTRVNPMHDSRPNNVSVPDVYSISTEFDSILVLRFKYDVDLLTSLDSLMKSYKIQNAVILSGIGSVRNYRYHVVSNRTFPTKNMIVKDPSAPADIVSMNGYVINGNVHVHITFSDADKSFGGHLELGTNVFTFAIVTIGVFKDGIDLKRADDKTYR
ncbi:MAG: PPC domain-containing DNA-binding protein [Bacteroidota bacterium]